MLSRILCLFFSSRGWMVGLIQTILYCVFVGYIVIESYVRRMERWLYVYCVVGGDFGRAINKTILKPIVPRKIRCLWPFNVFVSLHYQLGTHV